MLIRTGDSRKEKSKTIVKKAATGYQSETAKVQETYDISPIDFSEYSLSETTEKIVDINFTRESTDKHGDYMVCGHFPSTLMCHQFCTKCGFDLTQVDGYSAYAFSDEQMAIFTYCEGDVYFSPYKDKERYEKRKQETILFYTVFEGTIEDAISFVKTKPKSHIGDADMEGVVGRPLYELRDRRGERIIVKVKVRDYT